MESVYWYVHERNKENRIELYGINSRYFSTANFYIATISVSLHAITQWEIKVVLISDVHNTW